MRAGIVGREPELGLLRGYFQAPAFSRALVITGEAGIGKTTLWEAGIELARARGLRVLAARPSGAEARLSFAALIDVLETVDAAALAAVPAPQRLALEVALLRAEPARAPPEPHAIALGLLNGLRAVAADSRLLVAIDDAQWIDPPSGDALGFAARRLQDEPVSFLLARRPGPPSPLERGLERWGLERLEIGPLGLQESRRMLSDRLGLTLSRPLLRRVVDLTLGNPLFVLEVGRMLVGRGLLPVDGDLPVPDAVEDLLGTRVGQLAPALRRALVAVALSGDPRAGELVPVVGAEVLDDAVDAGLLRFDGGRVRASHPLLAAAAKKRSPPREQRALHRALADAVGDPKLRALHLAVASLRPDPELAATVASAAAEASARGARQEAVLLAEHGLRLTPTGSAQRGERLLALAEYVARAGRDRRLVNLLVPEVASLPAGSLRGRMWLALAECVESREESERLLDRALGESEGDPGLRARVVGTRAVTAVSVARIAEAEAWALGALTDARREGPDVELQVLYTLAWARAMGGRPIDDLCNRFRRVSGDAFYIAHSPARVAAQRLVWRGEVTQARIELERLLALADERGEPVSYALQRLHLCELELRAGGWDAASRLLDEWAESSEAMLLDYPMYERCRALLAAGRGVARDVERWAAKAVSLAERLGVRWDWLEALRARGTAALLERDPQRAVENLRVVWSHTRGEGVDEPGVFPVAPELVEALTELGEFDEALTVTACLRRLSDEQRHPWGLASAQRCQAVVRLAADSYDEQAAKALGGAAAAYERLGLCFDYARSVLNLGLAQRRMKKWGPARGSLQQAAVAFEELGSPGWASRARSELARVGGRRARPAGELTASEREVVALAANGLANKEIAQALHLAVHTVEVHLSRAYAKLGVRSRSQLAGRFSSHE